MDSENYDCIDCASDISNNKKTITQIKISAFEYN